MRRNRSLFKGLFRNVYFKNPSEYHATSMFFLLLFSFFFFRNMSKLSGWEFWHFPMFEVSTDGRNQAKKKKSFHYLIIDVIKHSSVAGGNARGRKMGSWSLHGEIILGIRASVAGHEEATEHEITSQIFTSKNGISLLWKESSRQETYPFRLGIHMH